MIGRMRGWKTVTWVAIDQYPDIMGKDFLVTRPDPVYQWFDQAATDLIRDQYCKKQQ